MTLNPRAEKRFNFDYYLNQPVKRDSDIKARSFEAPRYRGLDEEIGSHYFNANFYSGGGWKLWQNQHKKYNLMVDNLWVRGTMTIWEMVINQLRASNGTVIISSCAKTKEDGAVLAAGTSYHLWFDSGDNTSVDMQPFAVNDIIMARRFNMPNDGDTPTTLLEIYGTVTAISVGGENNKITFDTAGSPSTPLNKGVLEFVRIGNTSDASRQGSIVLTSDGIDSDLGGGGTGTVPYIDVYAGVDSRAKFLDKDYVKVRLGRLDEITGGVDEFGLYGNVVHLSGSGGSGWGTTLEGSGDPAGAGYAAADYTDGTLYFDFTNTVYYLLVSGSWTTMAQGINENGELLATPTPSGTGLFASGDYLGFYANGGWKGYWLNSGANAGDFFLKGASNTALWWDYSAAALYIGGLNVGDSYIKTVAGSGNIEFYAGNPRLNFMHMGANINGTGWYGIGLEEKAFIYKYNSSNNAVSTLHSELYNQTTNYIGGISTLVSTTTDGSTPAFTTINIMTGTKSQTYVTGAYSGAGVVAVGQGNSSGDIYGLYAYASNIGAGKAWGAYFAGDIKTYDIYPGNQEDKFFTYYTLGTYFSMNDDLFVGGDITLDGTVDGVDIAARDHTKYALLDDLIANEITQIKAINANTMDWTKLGNINQELATTDSPSWVRPKGTGQYLDISSGTDQTCYLMFANATQWLQWNNSTNNFYLNAPLKVSNGVDFSGVITNITIVGGIVTAAS